MTAMPIPSVRLLLIFVATVAAYAGAGLSTASAQDASTPSTTRLQAGLGVLPGIGVQGAYLLPGRFFTREGVLYVDWSPKFVGGEEATVQLSASVGGSVRIMGLIRFFSPDTEGAYDVDAGLRIGPSLFFSTRESRAEKNQRFSLFVEPFARFSSTFGSGQTFFLEVGTWRPILRAGLWFRL